ncbi:MAG: TetR/AcrR family transcriptional regulator [Phototrophicaceae bacterium]
MTSKNDAYHHGNLRDSLIDAAIDILTTQRAGDIKMREIGRMVGVSPSAAYRHFSDKSALLAAIAERGFNELAHHLEMIRQTTYESSGIQFEQVGKAYIIYAVEHAAQYRLMYGNEAVRQDEHPTLAIAARQMSRQVYQMVKVCQEDGLVKGDKPRQIMQTIWAATHGAAMLVIDGFIIVDDIDQFANSIVNHVSYGIAK